MLGGRVGPSCGEGPASVQERLGRPRPIPTDATSPQWDVEVQAGQVAVSPDKRPAAPGAADRVGAKLSCQLLGFLQAEVLPLANRAAEMGVDPTPLFATVIQVLRAYADALERPPPADGHRSR